MTFFEHYMLKLTAQRYVCSQNIGNDFFQVCWFLDTNSKSLSWKLDNPNCHIVGFVRYQFTNYFYYSSYFRHGTWVMDLVCQNYTKPDILFWHFLLFLDWFWLYCNGKFDFMNNKKETIIHMNFQTALLLCGILFTYSGTSKEMDEKFWIAQYLVGGTRNSLIIILLMKSKNGWSLNR